MHLTLWSYFIRVRVKSMLEIQQNGEKMKEYFEILKTCTLFDGIEASELAAMLHCLGAEVIHVMKNQTVFMEGEPAKDVGIVLLGMVQVEKVDYYGNRSIMTMIEPGYLFGEAFACADMETLPVGVTAVCDSTVMLIDCKRILNICGNACVFHNRLVKNLLRVMANKNLMLNQKIEFTSQRTTREKLMTYLLAQAKRYQSAEFSIPYDRQALADYLGVERSAMSAELSRMKKDGLVDYQKNHFRLL